MKYVVMETDGIVSRRFEVLKVEGYPDGYAYSYRNGNNQLDVVYAGLNYRPLEEPAPRMVILKRKGNSSAAVIMPTDADCPGEDLSSLVRTHLMALGYVTLYDKQVPWKWILIAGAVIGIVAVIYFVMQRGGA